MTRLKELSEPEKVPKPMHETFEAFAKLTDDFCEKHLNNEYRRLLRKLVAALCRKKPSPLLQGNTQTWAAGMIHALGTANFLFDGTQRPYVPSHLISEYFNLGQSTMSNKSKQIRNLMKISHWNPNWMLAERIEKSSLVWMVSLNGFQVDARYLPRQIQEAALEKGLIPYLPDQRQT